MKSQQTKIPRSVIVGLVLAIVLDTVIQIAWKLAVSDLPAGSSAAVTAKGALSNPFFYVAMLTFAAQLFNWTRVLAKADLSFAQPFTALSYLTVMAISGRFLHESLSVSKSIGVGLILLGVFFISRTPSSTAAASEHLQPDA
jgi:drug/metabolite transporter (DMT)-like permease